jgi:hypothetical protein
MRQSRAQAVARALGWFSIGLGLAELLAPRMVARLAGLRGRERLLQLYGAREIASGIGILFAGNPRPWVAARVAGDALDIATLVDAGNPKSTAALAAVGGVTALDAYATAALKPQPRPYFDYSRRSGFSRSVSEMRGAAAGKVREKRRMTPASEPALGGEQRLEHSASR